ncbi:DNA-binding transcriptional regulator, PadR family [Paenibacillus sp. UNC496MF]|uniref:helix-turn-helix transcriptional regulator n=1 Tax=Paenibacillus sp. UNC496MF TaxID=1502753 RepID=UPI0008E0E565|nr:helix-turn-helix transcriptional regulator [Paenibacillus sp. UNC496MF]SFJ54385.1 DNA-binding transcriptional regulator, PadR family [Paenibacillus sp. UNC496MF]
MPRNQHPIEKTESFGQVLKVQQVIDFMVLSDLLNGQRYHSEMEQFITQTFEGVGVNDAYFSSRLKALAESGHVTRHWDGDNRYNRYYQITDSGVTYFKLMLRELPDRVKRAKRVYDRFETYIQKFGSMHLK